MIEICTEVDISPRRLLGRCIGVPGKPPCGRLIPESDVNAVETDQGTIGSCCIADLFPIVRPTSPRGAYVTLKRKAGRESARLPSNRLRIKPNRKDVNYG